MKARDLIVILAVIALLAAVPKPRFISRPRGRPIACSSNVKNIATALEMYYQDNAQRYPLRLKDLERGNYLKLVPTCPATGTDTYTPAYRTFGCEFSFGCQGNNHGKLGYPADHPRYTSHKGLRLR